MIQPQIVTYINQREREREKKKKKKTLKVAPTQYSPGRSTL
jgi:hypothetical protein